jgi:hypothetical protein
MPTNFDHETLDVYQLEPAFIAWLVPLLAKVEQYAATTRTAEVIND